MGRCPVQFFQCQGTLTWRKFSEGLKLNSEPNADTLIPLEKSIGNPEHGDSFYLDKKALSSTIVVLQLSSPLG